MPVNPRTCGRTCSRARGRAWPPHKRQGLPPRAYGRSLQIYTHAAEARGRLSPTPPPLTHCLADLGLSGGGCSSSFSLSAAGGWGGRRPKSLRCCCCSSCSTSRFAGCALLVRTTANCSLRVSFCRYCVCCCSCCFHLFSKAADAQVVRRRGWYTAAGIRRRLLHSQGRQAPRPRNALSGQQRLAPLSAPGCSLSPTLWQPTSKLPFTNSCWHSRRAARQGSAACAPAFLYEPIVPAWLARLRGRPLLHPDRFWLCGMTATFPAL